MNLLFLLLSRKGACRKCETSSPEGLFKRLPRLGPLSSFPTRPRTPLAAVLLLPGSDQEVPSKEAERAQILLSMKHAGSLLVGPFNGFVDIFGQLFLVGNHSTVMTTGGEITTSFNLSAR
jgi:hypothetical protein